MTSPPAKGLFHVHTTHSHDGKSSLGELARFCSEQGIGYVCITDHADFMDDAAVRKLVLECDAHAGNGVRFVPGLEYAYPGEGDVHLLCIGIREPVRCDLIGETVDEVRRGGGLSVVAHPSRNGHYIPEEIVPKIDGIEVWNGTYDSRYLPDAGSVRLWERVRQRNPNVMAFAGLDMHDVRRFRGISLVMDGEMPGSETALVEDLRRGRFRGEGPYYSIDAANPPSSWTVMALAAGRPILRLADRIRWSVRSKVGGAGKRKRT